MERTAAKKSLAVTLVLAILLSLPGSAAWSQTYGARVVPITPVGGAQAGAAVSAIAMGAALIPSLSINSLGVSALTPVLSAPAVTPSELAAVVAVLAANGSVTGRAQLDAVAGIAGEAAAEKIGVEVVSLGRVFDGSNWSRWLRPKKAASVFSR